jgi:hypothetical protein
MKKALRTRWVLALISNATVFGSLAVAQGALSLSYLGTAGWEISDG